MIDPLDWVPHLMGSGTGYLNSISTVMPLVGNYFQEEAITLPEANKAL